MDAEGSPYLVGSVRSSVDEGRRLISGRISDAVSANRLLDGTCPSGESKSTPIQVGQDRLYNERPSENQRASTKKPKPIVIRAITPRFKSTEHAKVNPRLILCLTR